MTLIAMKAQALADHLAENPIDEEYGPLKTYFPNEEVLCVDEVIRDVDPGWKLFFNGAVNMKEVGVGVVLISEMLQHPDKAYIDPVHIQSRDQHAYCNVVEEKLDGEPWFFDIKQYIQFGLPKMIITDNAANLDSHLMQEVEAKGKFSQNWQGPFVVKKVLPNGALYLIDIEGKWQKWLSMLMRSKDILNPPEERGDEIESRELVQRTEAADQNLDGTSLDSPTRYSPSTSNPLRYLSLDSFITWLAAEILKSLGFLAAEEVGSIYGLCNELQNLSATVSSIQAVLIDAEELQGRSHQVQDWIMRLKKVFFEVDDLLDDFATEIMHRKLVDKIGIFFSKSNPMIYNFKISHRLKAIRRDLDVIAKDKASLNLVEKRQQPLLPEPYSVQLNLYRQTYSFVPKGEVIGRSDDKQEIVDFLLDSEFEENVVVISIVGLGGLGKTTLAQCVYNDEMIKKNFDKALWVCVSDVFEVKMIAEKIIESGGGEQANYLQLEAVQNELRKMLDGKKYLLVLDDVCNEDPLKWSNLKNMLIG
ncbi:hypothetical protein FXO37_14053 [Capsicum annuum]|nr:hypothetical protein FXO37_14053 [Capsicum annuum]